MIDSIVRNTMQQNSLSVITMTGVIDLKSDGTLSSGGSLKRVQTLSFCCTAFFHLKRFISINNLFASNWLELSPRSGLFTSIKRKIVTTYPTSLSRNATTIYNLHWKQCLNILVLQIVTGFWSNPDKSSFWAQIRSDKKFNKMKNSHATWRLHVTWQTAEQPFLLSIQPVIVTSRIHINAFNHEKTAPTFRFSNNRKTFLEVFLVSNFR